jgi:hypothetical protein
VRSIRLEPTGFFQNLVNFRAYGLREALNSESKLWRCGVEPSSELPWIDAVDVSLACVGAMRLADVDQQASNDVGSLHYRLCGPSFSLNHVASVVGLTYEQVPRDELVRQFRDIGADEALAADRALVYATYHERHFPVMHAGTAPLLSLLRRAAAPSDSVAVRPVHTFLQQLLTAVNEQQQPATASINYAGFID